MHRPTLIKCSPRNVKIVRTPLRDTTTLWDPYPGPPTLEIMQTKCIWFPPNLATECHFCAGQALYDCEKLTVLPQTSLID